MFISCAKKDVINIEDLHNPYILTPTDSSITEVQGIIINDTYKKVIGSTYDYYVEGYVDISKFPVSIDKLTLDLFISSNGTKVMENSKVSSTQVPFVAKLRGDFGEVAPIQLFLDVTEPSGAIHDDYLKFNQPFPFKTR